VIWWPAAPRGSLRGSTRSRRSTVCLGSTSIGRRIVPPFYVGGTGTRSRPGSTSSRCLLSGKALQKFLCAEVRTETGRWKDGQKIRDLQADERCCRSVLDFLSDVWVEGQPRPAEAAALSCVRKASGGGGGNSPLVTRQATTGDIYTRGGKLPPWVSGRVSDV